MDVESATAVLWMVAAVGGAVGAIGMTIRVAGWTVDSTFEVMLTAGVVIGVLIWITFCTWRIQQVGITPPAELPTPNARERRY